MASSVFNVILEIFGGKAFADEKPKAYMLEALDGYRKALGGLKVLVAEDNPINQELAVEIFRTIGVEAVIAEDGAKALEALSSQSFDAVLMDIQMPQMDGYEATRRIRENDQLKAMPIIAMTASALPSDEKKCLDAGMNDYVAKPIQLKKLFQKLYDNILNKDESGVGIQPEPYDMPSVSGHHEEPLPDQTRESRHGLNIDQAMRNLKIDPDAYLRIVEAFFKKNLHAMKQIRIWEGTQNWKEIQALAHSMAGSSGNIGAFNLQSAARGVESCCRNAESDTACLSRMELLLEKLDEELSLTLGAIVDFASIKQAKGPADESERPDLMKAERCLADLFQALKESDPILITASLNNLKKNLDDSLVNIIEAKIMDYEYEEAGRMLYNIASNMGVNLTWDITK
jgi:CheY-like chemotaxis protein